MTVIDKDLEFLNHLNNEDMKDLYDIVVYGKKEDVEKDNKRINENISRLLVSNDYKRISRDIVEEFKKYGSNSVATMLWRGGKGVEYKEILLDVCANFGVKPAKYRTVEEIEQELIERVVEESIKKMSPEEIRELIANADVKINPDLPIAEAATAAFIYVFKAGGFKSYKYTAIVANAVLKALIGKGLSFAGNGMLMRTMSILTGPIGWVVTGAWTAIDLLGPAYRVTIPFVIQIILLRNIHKANQIDSKWMESVSLEKE